MEVTRTLARYVVNSKLADIPADVRREAVRSVVNWLGCAVGSCRHEAVDAALAAARAVLGPEASLGARPRGEGRHPATPRCSTASPATSSISTTRI